MHRTRRLATTQHSMNTKQALALGSSDVMAACIGSVTLEVTYGSTAKPALGRPCYADAGEFDNAAQAARQGGHDVAKFLRVFAMVRGDK